MEAAASRGGNLFGIQTESEAMVQKAVRTKTHGKGTAGPSDQKLIRKLTKSEMHQKEGMPTLQEAGPTVPEKSIPKAGVNDKSQVTIVVTEEMAKDICVATGTRATAIGRLFFGQALAVQIQTGHWLNDGVEWEERALEALREMEPSNATEGMLAIQMIAVHNAAVNFMVDATAQSQTFEGKDAGVLRATRLMRLFNEQLEAMAKLKGKAGQQKVTVEHVHINAGGQAIVGAVNAGKGSQGGGGGEES